MPRTPFIPMLFALTLFTMTCMARAQAFDPASDRQPPSISVTGSAVTRVAPDFAEWHITLEALDKDPAAAKAQVDAWVEQLFEVRDALDIEKADFETGPVSVEKVYEYVPTDRHHERVFKGYRVSRQIVVRQRELDEFDAFLTAFAKEGHTFTMRLRASQEDELRQQTRIEAVKAAKQKAQELADAVGVAVKTLPLHIDAAEEQPIPYAATTNRMVMAEAGGGGSDAPYTPGMIEIRVTVQATFQLVDLTQ